MHGKIYKLRKEIDMFEFHKEKSLNKWDKIKLEFDNFVPEPEGEYIKSSVMILLTEKNGELEILYTKRALSLRHQPGDICFPGGRSEKGEKALETAFRETKEELGINSDKIKILGQTNYFITPFKGFITPFMGYIENLDLKDLNYNKSEVEKIFTVPVKFFVNEIPKKGIVTYEPSFSLDFPFDMIYSGKEYKWIKPEYKEYFYNYKENIIWGLTARITIHVCKILENIFTKYFEQSFR